MATTVQQLADIVQQEAAAALVLPGSMPASAPSPAQRAQSLANVNAALDALSKMRALNLDIAPTSPPSGSGYTEPFPAMITTG